VIGIQQTCCWWRAGQHRRLAVASAAGAAALWGACAALMAMLLTDRGDKAVAEQIAVLRPIAALAAAHRAPVPPRHRFTLLPGVPCWLLRRADAGPRAGGYSHTVAAVWLCFAAIAQSPWSRCAGSARAAASASCSAPSSS
jgi:hypothetical protein